jgi:hypothetical protein
MFGDITPPPPVEKLTTVPPEMVKLLAPDVTIGVPTRGNEVLALGSGVISDAPAMDVAVPVPPIEVTFPAPNVEDGTTVAFKLGVDSPAPPVTDVNAVPPKEVRLAPPAVGDSDGGGTVTSRVVLTVVNTVVSEFNPAPPVEKALVLFPEEVTAAFPDVTEAGRVLV